MLPSSKVELGVRIDRCSRSRTRFASIAARAGRVLVVDSTARSAPLTSSLFRPKSGLEKAPDKTLARTDRWCSTYLLHLHQDPPHQLVLPCRGELDAAVRHYQLVGWDIGRCKRDANFLGIAGAG